ncbi:MAG: hypothetical protein HGB19_01115 [Chlorobiales bacterium]|jgi:cell division protein FtsL|nr:hypothetical protein [Chlorobiales bacterium]
MSNSSLRGNLFSKEGRPRSGYTDGTIDDFLVKDYQRRQGRDTFAEPIENIAPEVQEESAQEDESKPDASRRRLKAEAHQRIESILTLRTFVLLVGSTIVLALYIYNVISINRLAGEAEQLRQHVEETRSLNTILEARLHKLQRVEHISSVAYEELGLRVKTEMPVELEQ